MANLILDPNFAYLLLAGGFMLAVMALIIPGTGLLEVGAMFILILAGWIAVNLTINLWALLLLLFGAFPFLMALRRSKRPGYLVVSITAFVIGSAYLFRGDAWWQPAVNPLLALAVSTFSTGYFWIAARKVLESEGQRPTHDLQSIIGALGEAKSEIRESGSVHVNGELWSAYSRDPIPAGTPVQVVGRRGLVLEVHTAARNV